MQPMITTPKSILSTAVLLTVQLMCLHSRLDEFHTDMTDSTLICTDFDALRYVQSVQFERAVNEIDGVDDREGYYFKPGERALAKKNFNFYLHNSSYLQLNGRVKGAKNTPISIIYYRILKNASYQILALLHRFALHAGFNICPCPTEGPASATYLATFENIDKTGNDMPVCSKNCGVFAFSKNAQRFPFTIVRNPLQRFISGYSEIENLFGRKRHNLPLHSPRGTIARFQEFIRVVVYSKGSSQLFDHPHYQMRHISPQIGPIFIAQEKEKSKINLYKFEELFTEWKRLATDSNISRLSELFMTQQLFPHLSSKDRMGTTAAARRFFAPVLDLTSCTSSREREGDGSTPSSTDSMAGLARDTVEEVRSMSGHISQGTLDTALVGRSGKGHGRACSWLNGQASYHYFRALCRVYLVDYVCTGYTLPAVCSDIGLELHPLLEEHLHSKKRKEKSDSNSSYEPYYSLFVSSNRWRAAAAIAHSIIPGPVLAMAAQVLCLFAQSPQCVADIVNMRDFMADSAGEEL